MTCKRGQTPGKALPCKSHSRLTFATKNCSPAILDHVGTDPGEGFANYHITAMLTYVAG